jgi:hypothetical protein
VENKHKLLNPILSRFCEIFVPEYVDVSGNAMNLHQWQIQQTYSFHSEIESEQQRFLEDAFLGIFREKEEKTKIDHMKMVDLATSFYENAISSLDLIHWFKGSTRWTDFEKSNVCMLYSKIKPEFRCEKLLMLFLLDFAFLRPGSDIREISFM